jgi:predicted RecA/RadA family phage recombinase
MQAKKLTLAAGTETAFEFDSFYSRSIIVKNMTGGAIQFCDGPFDAAKSAIIPAFGWQAFTVTVPYGETPKFHVKADVAGDVEIDFGSDGMGFTSNTFDLAGMIPHTLTLTQGEDTALTVELTRLHGQTLDLANAVPMTSGATVFNGDVISITPTATAGHYAKLKINGVNYGRLESAMTLVIAGETTIETEAVDLVEKTVTLDVGAGTTLTAAQTRLAGMLVDLTTPANVVSGGTVYVGDTVEFTAATTQGTGYHVTLTIDTELADLDENGKVSVEVADDITAVSASVTDGGGE